MTGAGSIPETPDSDHAGVRLPPPLVYIGLIAVGALLDGFVAPLPLPGPFGVRLALTILTGVLGLAFMVGAAVLFRRTGQAPEPWTPTPTVISSGVYAHTRNPMYVSMALLQASIGFGWGKVWIVGLVPLALAIVYYTAVRPEEAYLERKFGNAYLDYKEGVRRWL